MSNGITTLQPGMAPSLPAAFQGQKAAQAFIGHTFEKGDEGVEGGYGVIKYAGKVWALAYKGETKHFLRPDDGTPQGYIDVIMVRAAGNKAKTMYDKFVEGSHDKPICFSNDGKKPDPSIQTPPSKVCVSCPKNVVGSRLTDDGKKAKACGDHKRTAVVLDPALATRVLGVPLSEAVLLRIPAASLTDFANFGTTMDRQGFPLPSFVCRISFDHTKNYPKFKFEAIRPLSNEEGAISMALRNDPSATRIVNDASVVATDDDGADDAGTIQNDPPAGVNANQVVAAMNAGGQPGVNGMQVQPNPQPAPSNVVQMTAAPDPKPEPRPTPAQQAQAMTPDPAAAPTTAFEADLDKEINALLS